MDRALFLFLLSNATPYTIHMLDNAMCRCGYVSHWVNKMDWGHFNPGLTEMDHELREVKTPDQLYAFLISRKP